MKRAVVFIQLSQKGKHIGSLEKGFLYETEDDLKEKIVNWANSLFSDVTVTYIILKEID